MKIIIIIFSSIFCFAVTITDFNGKKNEFGNKTPFKGEENSVVKILERIQSSLYDVYQNEKPPVFRRMERARGQHLRPIFDIIRRVEDLHKQALMLIEDSDRFLKSELMLRGPFLDKDLRFTLNDISQFRKQLDKALESIPDDPKYVEEIAKLKSLRNITFLINQYFENLPISIERAITKINQELSPSLSKPSNQMRNLCLDSMAALVR